MDDSPGVSVTERRATSQQTQSAPAARLAHLYEESFDPVLLTHPDGTIIDANPQALVFLAQAHGDLIGKNLRNLHHAHDPLPSPESLATGKSFTFEGSIMVSTAGSAGAHDCPVKVRVQLVHQEGGTCCQWLYRDLSNQMALEQLRQDLIVMLVHDLKSPLGNVISSLDLIKPAIQKSRHDPELLLLLDLASRSSQQLKRLIDSLLDIRRLEAGQPLGKLAPVHLQKIAENAYEIEQPNFERRGILLRKDLPDTLPPAFVDESMMERVLLNLLDNALKYSGDGQLITIAAEETEDGMLLLTVSDEGKGIPVKDRERIFEKYQRIQSDSASKGLGLGLAFCRLAVEAHGGRIWVEDAPGGGARFNVTMRVAHPQQTLVAMPLSESAAPPEQP